ncbi:Crp/Fnr family transcriptional regulator [Neolewinella litorea]|uniref:Crp/Fnr family transcriptional regulator n=1 Tax=Neolewinella litorea TaxID=2562452 RepID=A0A4S4N6Y0_9BACT|nr:Crp/Fnr family transcriptional regulator [Neolewinella litorea]THH34902.1 Crp/Fnr family transcriptional regulator [Neolewinella litorea]
MQSETLRPIVDTLLENGVDVESAERLVSYVGHRTYQAKAHIFGEGDPLPPTLFLLSGYVRLYVTDDEGNICTQLVAGPGEFVACVYATLYDQLAHFTCECISDCHVAVIDHHVMREIKQQDRSRSMMQAIFIDRLTDMMQEKSQMLPLKATERYLFFRERYPELIERIPSGIVANYIGVRPQSLSRIKQGLK